MSIPAKPSGAASRPTVKGCAPAWSSPTPTAIGMTTPSLSLRRSYRGAGRGKVGVGGPRAGKGASSGVWPAPRASRGRLSAGSASLAVVWFALGSCGAPSGPRDADPPALILEEELRLGALEGPEEQLFVRVAGVAPAPDGGIVVLDRETPAVRRFGPDGTFLGEVSRAGDGPGEFRNPTGIVPLPGGGVALWDGARGRLSLWNADGDLRSEVTLAPGIAALGADTLGRLYVRIPHGLEAWQPAARTDPPPQAWVRVSAGGEVLDTVPVPEAAPRGAFLTLRGPEGELRSFVAMTLDALGVAGEVLYAHNQRYLVLRERSSGAPDTLIRREAEPVALDGEERAAWEALVVSYRERTRDVFDSAALPAAKPILKELWRDRRGRIWVQLHVEARRAAPLRPGLEGDPDRPPPLSYREPPFFHLYTSEGELLGAVELPVGSRVVDAHRDLVWAVEGGSFGEEYVVRYRMEGR